MKASSKFPPPKVFGNLVFASTVINAENAYNNGVGQYFEASKYLKAPFDSDQPSFFPIRPITNLTNTVSVLNVPKVQDANLDFYGAPRRHGDIGAIASSVLNQ